jgi:unsaturated rhamnogalacturonyl hydrolase
MHTQDLPAYFETYLHAYQPYKEGAWCYEDGVIYRGLECLHRLTGAPQWRLHLERLITPQIEAGPQLRGYDPDAYNIDNIQPGRALLYLHELTGQAQYLEAAALLAEQLRTHPRTPSGVYWHKLRYPWQVWLDGLYMGPPFQIAFGQRRGDTALVDDALRQIETALQLAYVPKTGLYAHAVDEVQKQPWATPGTGHTRAHWARALGWLAMALVDVATLVGPQRFAPLAEQTRALMQRLAGLRQSNGLWLQVIDQPQLQGNYGESSASAMMVYALLRAQALGLYDGPLGDLMPALLASAMKRGASGAWQMADMCHVAGLGPYEGRYRDGTAAYYISERRVADDAKGVGPLMMAAAAMALQPEPARA